MGTNGKGAIAFTVVGEDYYPSAGYARSTRPATSARSHRRRRARAVRRLHELQGVRRRPAANALGRLRGGRHGRQRDLARLGVHRPDVHVRAVLPGAAVTGRLRELRCDPHLARELGDATSARSRRRSSADGAGSGRPRHQLPTTRRTRYPRQDACVLGRHRRGCLGRGSCIRRFGRRVGAAFTEMCCEDPSRPSAWQRVLARLECPSSLPSHVTGSLWHA